MEVKNEEKKGQRENEAEWVSLKEEGGTLALARNEEKENVIGFDLTWRY